jgi:hypothetical protein
MLHPFFDINGIISLAWSPPAPVTSIQAKNIELGLIGENDCTPILLRPITMMFSPVYVLPPMSSGEQGLRSALVSIKPTLFECFPNGVLVNIGEKLPL